MATAAQQRKAWHGHIQALREESTSSFPDHRAKLEQLHSHLATVDMLLDELHDTNPASSE